MDKHPDSGMSGCRWIGGICIRERITFVLLVYLPRILIIKLKNLGNERTYSPIREALMRKASNQGWKIGLLVLILAMACNLPTAESQGTDTPALSPQDMAATSVAQTLTARVDTPQEATSEPVSDEGTTPPEEPTATLTYTPTVTPCYAMVTATVDANVRTGPGTVYDIVGALPLNSSARVFGQNDARTWWYIEFPGGSGRYAWVAGSVTTAACIPDNLQYVAAPPTPTPIPPTITPTHIALPDLYVSEYSWSPIPPHMGVSFHVRIGVYNQGNAPAGPFVVQWWLTTSGSGPTCHWGVTSLVAHGGRILECNYTPGGWSNYPSAVYVDVGDHVTESDEGNNTRTAPLQIAP